MFVCFFSFVKTRKRSQKKQNTKNMIPIAHVIARRRADAKRQRELCIDQSPYERRPLCGVFEYSNPSAPSSSSLPSASTHLPSSLDNVRNLSSPLTPDAVHVDIQLEHTLTTYRLMFSYEKSLPQPSQAARRFDFYFPASECGNIQSIVVKLNHSEKENVGGEIVRCGRRDGRFISSSDREQFLVVDSDAESDKRKPMRPHGVPQSRTTAKEPTIFYYRVENILEKALAMSAGSPTRIGQRQKLDIHVEVVTKTVRGTETEDEELVRPAHRSRGHYRVLFPLLGLPASPDTIHFFAKMPYLIRSVVSPSVFHRKQRQQQAIVPFLNNEEAEFNLEFTDRSPLRLEEYLLIIDVELGDPIVPECLDPITLLVLVTTVAMMVFHFMVRDLEEVNF